MGRRSSWAWSLLRAHFTDFGGRPDVFLDRDTNICYDRGNLNVRIVPDLYLAFGVDATSKEMGHGKIGPDVQLGWKDRLGTGCPPRLRNGYAQ